MSYIKKILTFVLLCGIVISMTSCGLNIGSETVLETEDIIDEEDAGLTVIGFSQPGAESTWRVALTESIRDTFTEELGYRIIYKDGRSKQDNQIRDVRTFIQQGVDYIVLSPIVETGWDAVLEEAKAAGIPVIICDRNVVVSNESLYTAFVGSNFLAEGQNAIRYMEEFYASAEEEVNIVHIQGTIGSSAQMGRSEAIEDAAAAHENWNIIAQACGEFTNAKSREVMKGILEEVDFNSIDVIYCENDESAMGVMAALNEAGVSYGEGTKIQIISFDATSRACELCKSGLIACEVECNPLQGPFVYNIIETLQKGDVVPKITYIDEKYYTKDTLTTEFVQNRTY